MAQRSGSAAAVDDMAGGDTRLPTVDPKDSMSRAHGGSEFTPDGPSFQEAARLAIEEHSKAPEHADRAGDSTDEDEEEVGTGKAEAAAKTGTVTTADEGKTPATESAFLTQDELTALQTTHKNDPAALYKALEGAFTKKTQALAVERKAVERVAPYVDLIEAYEDDQEGVIAILAERNGLKVVKKDGSEVAAPGGEKTPAAAATTVTETPEEELDALRTDVQAILGDELDYLVDPLTKLLDRVGSKIADARVQKTVEPLIKAETQRVTEASKAETAAIVKQFSEKHPGWEKHDAAMLTLAQKVQLVPGTMTELEYMEHLFTLVTAPEREAARSADTDKEADKRAAKLVDRLSRGAADAESTRRPMPDKLVTVKRPEGATIRDSWEAAKRGEQWTD